MFARDGTPQVSEKRCEDSRDLENTETSFNAGTWRMASAWTRATLPQPMIPIPIGSTFMFAPEVPDAWYRPFGQGRLALVLHGLCGLAAYLI